jgi:hypothetical protein
MQVYDPTAPNSAPARDLRQSVADLSGKVIGFIDNTKPNFNLLAQDIGELLRSRYGVKTVIQKRKRSVATAAPNDVLDELARDCDLVITGSGD